MGQGLAQGHRTTGHPLWMDGLFEYEWALRAGGEGVSGLLTDKYWDENLNDGFNSDIFPGELSSARKMGNPEMASFAL